MVKVGNDVTIRWGRALQEFRSSRGMTQSALGRALGVGGTAISNLERGVRRPSHENLQLLDSTLETGGKLKRLWTELNQSGHLAWLGRLSELEQEAVSIQEFQNQLIPSLLQTEQYALMVMKAISPWLPIERVKEGARIRCERGERFLERSSPFMVAVVSEAVLSGPVDDRVVMREQLEHLVSVAAEGRISLQVVQPGGHPGLVGPFKVLTPQAGPAVIYTESAYKGQFVDDAAVVAEFRLRFGHIQAEADKPSASLDRVREVLEGLKDD
ncbi:helix-turn-helix domain-containing protein [Nocardiopsis suaedae]|uniref:Helix-turn-helix transcriptional regulator n=1 Tax=Nocardiopsis suaedae TaxID=3018444 RepID=A0ABT4TLS2_9ACTN|nr:helix-turn-helix transcriptional regulator [Nocardiopsis suaedae]MDA2805645.1 helix-turn-helix transcriptional regulator [Nocardiopsis suaedae]